MREFIAIHDPQPTNRMAFAAIVVLALLFALHAFLAARTKTPTVDEPFHTLASWLIVNEGDFRLSPEHPPLWRYIAGLPLIRRPLSIDLMDEQAKGLFKRDPLQWYWGARVLFQTPGNDGIALVARSRAMMCVFPFVLALVVGRWAWAWGGPPAGVLAVALLAFEPNLLAHAGLVTNDVAATLIFTLAAYLTWRIGTRFTRGTAIALALTCAAGVGTKMSCLLLGPMVGVPLLVRSMSSDAWRIGRWEVRAHLPRLLAVLAYGLGVIFFAGLLLWPLYLFRYQPTRFEDSFNDQRQRMLQMMFTAEGNSGRRLTYVEQATVLNETGKHEPGLVDRIAYDLTDRHFLPHAWGYGYAYVRANSLVRPSFLLGVNSDRGFFWYFPIAIACKTPVITIGLTLFALAAAVARGSTLLGSPTRRWKCICLVVPPMIYFIAAVGGNLNIGIRHVLPVYPAIYVGIALAVVSATRAMLPRIRVGISIAIVAVLAIETTSAFPNYISYFNFIGGGSRGGAEILSDSNLDWGQDLNALADWYREWRKTNPHRPFYLSYFGSVDPHLYGIDYTNAMPGYAFASTPAATDFRGGTYAISLSALQSPMSTAEGSQTAMESLGGVKPIAIINDTFYIYNFGPAPATRSVQPATMPATP